MILRHAGFRMRTGRASRGFTLVELLIAMTLTLILVYAIAQFYAFVGETVRDGRAQIEMGGNLRAASQRLRQDLAEMTVRVGGRIDSGGQQGGLEIWEGVATDSDPNGDQGDANGDGVFDNTNPSNTYFISNDFVDVNGDGKPDSPMLGDCDDILVMTIRSQSEPYVGRHCFQIPNTNPPQYDYETIRSNLAEVIWFTTFKDTNGDGAWQVTEPRYLVRRQLLIIPGISLVWPAGASAPFNPGESVYSHNDISCHAVLNNMGQFAGFVANTLGDLSQRENRMVHQNLSTLNQNGLFAGQGYMPNTLQLNVGLIDAPAIPLYQNGSCSLYSLDGILKFQGEDKMLSNVLAFDVRVFDPFAVLRADNSDTTNNTTTTDDDAQGVLSPCDAGYAAAVLGNFPMMGDGAYVDLWYNRAFARFPPAQRAQVLQNSAYSWAPQARNFPIGFVGGVWDTWTTAYEKDGIDQYSDNQTDYLVDGLDNNNTAGVDDPSEAETRPPYPVWVGDNGQDDDGQNGADDMTEQSYARPLPTTLRGIEVRIRIYEPGTRQTRQATVATDFIPE